MRMRSHPAFGRIANLLGASEIDSDIWENLEAMLIQADLGIETTAKVIEDAVMDVKDEAIKNVKLTGTE